MMNRTIAIVGGGISGLMASYRVLSEDKSTNVILIEKGNRLEKRVCPILTKKSDVCIKCTHCAIMEGMAGAGAFSDGKYNITTEFGGWLQEILPSDIVLDYIEQADSILVEHGATTKRFSPSNELKRECLKYDLHMLQSECKHLGTDANFDTMVKLIQKIESYNNFKLLVNTEVEDVYDEGDKKVLKLSSGIEVLADIVIFAVGRVGSNFLQKWCERNNILMNNNQVDIGVRVELPSMIWEEFEKKIYEPKIFYTTKGYGDKVRMFCFNGRGEVVAENTNGVLTVNGHAYEAEEKKTKNSNFALLSTIRFTYPFREPIEYARHIAKLANMITGGGVIVQRLGDLEMGRRTDDSRLAKSTVRPTLKGAVAGDLSLCLPKRQLDNIIEALHALDKVAPGTANSDTLLYGLECKYYSARPETGIDFQLSGRPNYYAIGDGAGFTRSLAQAAAQGLYVADKILGK